MKLLVSFMMVFCFIMCCVVAVGFCGGMTFGTAPFGWLIGFGVMGACICGAAVAIAIDESTSRKK